MESDLQAALGRLSEQRLVHLESPVRSSAQEVQEAADQDQRCMRLCKDFSQLMSPDLLQPLVCSRKRYPAKRWPWSRTPLHVWETQCTASGWHAFSGRTRKVGEAFQESAGVREAIAYNMLAVLGDGTPFLGVEYRSTFYSGRAYPAVLALGDTVVIPGDDLGPLTTSGLCQKILDFLDPQFVSEVRPPAYGYSYQWGGIVPTAAEQVWSRMTPDVFIAALADHMAELVAAKG